MSESKAIYIGIDLETTGLDPRKDRIIEVAAVILDKNFDELDAYNELVECPVECVRSAHPRVINMHLANGLFCRDSLGHLYQEDTGEMTPRPIVEVESDLLDFAQLQLLEKPILVGSSVHFDRAFLEHWMPAFAAKLSHRQVDDRTIKQLAPGLFPSGESPKGTPKEQQHRALSDIRNTVSNLKRAQRIFAMAEERSHE